MSMDELKLNLFARWNTVLRSKASVYEHQDRKNRKIVTSPSIDDICNEMDAFITGLIK